MPIVTEKPHDLCNGTGYIGGEPDPICDATGMVPVGSGPHDQNKWNIRYIVEQIDIVQTKLDALDVKMDTLDTHLGVIEAKIDALE